MKKLIISLSSLLVVASPIAMTIACSKESPTKPGVPDGENPGSVDLNITLVETERARLDAIDSIVLPSGDYSNNLTFETAVRNHSLLSLNSSFTYVIVKGNNNFTIQVTKGNVNSSLVTISYTVANSVDSNITLVENEKNRISSLTIIAVPKFINDNVVEIENYLREHSSLNLSINFVYSINVNLSNSSFTIQITKGTITSNNIVLQYNKSIIVDNNRYPETFTTTGFNSYHEWWDWVEVLSENSEGKRVMLNTYIESTLPEPDQWGYITLYESSFEEASDNWYEMFKNIFGFINLTNEGSFNIPGNFITKVQLKNRTWVSGGKMYMYSFMIFRTPIWSEPGSPTYEKEIYVWNK